MRIVAVGSPKGGVGKTTSAVHLARCAAEKRQRVLLVDGDPIRSASDWAGAMSEIDVTAVDDADAAVLARLRDVQGYDLAVVDLPGARHSQAWRALLAGRDGQAVPDLLVIPSRPRVIDLRPALHLIRHDVQPLKLPYLLSLTLVHAQGRPVALARREELRAADVIVATTVIRDYTIYDQAHENGRTVMDMPGVFSRARAAELDQRSLADEIMKIIK